MVQFSKLQTQGFQGLALHQQNVEACGGCQHKDKVEAPAGEEKCRLYRDAFQPKPKPKSMLPFFDDMLRRMMQDSGTEGMPDFEKFLASMLDMKPDGDVPNNGEYPSGVDDGSAQSPPPHPMNEDNVDEYAHAQGGNEFQATPTNVQDSEPLKDDSDRRDRTVEGDVLSGEL